MPIALVPNCHAPGGSDGQSLSAQGSEALEDMAFAADADISALDAAARGRENWAGAWRPRVGWWLRSRNDTIGVDISKDHLDAYRMSDGASRRFTNDKAGHQTFLVRLGQPSVRVVYEPTGPYHRTFERRLADAGLAPVKVNPRQARRFAETTGRLAKTDRLDAAMLAKMGALLNLEARPVRSPILNDLKDLHMAREALVKKRTA
jgi:transposase